jgi:hypothetical protein
VVSTATSVRQASRVTSAKQVRLAKQVGLARLEKPALGVASAHEDERAKQEPAANEVTLAIQA